MSEAHHTQATRFVAPSGQARLLDARAGLRRLLPLSMLLVIGACGRAEDGPAAASGEAGLQGLANPGDPRGHTADAAPRDGRPALLAEKTEVLGTAATTLDKALLARSPLLDATVSIRTGLAPTNPPSLSAARPQGRPTFEASLRYRVPLAELGARERLVFPLATNEGGPPRVTLDRLEVNGAVTSAGGTSARWEVPVEARDGVAEVVLHLSGELPSFDERRQRRALEQELDALPALAHLLPEIPQLEPPEAFGASEHLIILAGAFPTLSGTPPAVFRLEVRVDPEASGWTALATGREVASDGPARRFVGLSHGLGVVLGQGITLTREAVSGRELTLAHRELPTPASQTDSPTQELLRLSRRSLESHEDRLGPLDGSSLTILVSEDLDELGAAALPGLILLPRRYGPLAPPRPKTQPAAEDWLGKVELLLAHHPGPREAYERTLATAMGRLPWIGWDPGPLGRLLEHGFAADTALRAVRGTMGEKAQRRTLELGWRLPYQLGRMRGAADPALITLSASDDPSAAQVARAKSGLAFEALGRALGDPPWTALTAELLAARRQGTPLTEELLHQLLSKHAPRPDLAVSLWTRWTHERRGDTDVGELRPEVLLEYLVTDGAVTGLSHALMDNAGELAASPLGQKALARLGSGESLDPGFAVAMLGELLGPSLDPTSRRWLELGTGLFSKESRKTALEGLIDELGGELGIPEADRARLGLLGGLVLDALDAPTPPPTPDTPPGPTTDTPTEPAPE